MNNLKTKTQKIKFITKYGYMNKAAIFELIEAFEIKLSKIELHAGIYKIVRNHIDEFVDAVLEDLSYR